MVDGDHERAGGMGRAHEREAETRDGAGTHVGGFTSMPWVPNDAKETGGGEKRRAFLGSRGRDPHNSLQTKRQKERKRETHPKIIGKTTSGSGSRSRDLWVMSPARYPLRQTAMMPKFG